VRLRAAAGLALCLVALTGCDDSGDDESGVFDPVIDEVSGLDAGARERKLRELARAEGGELTFYTSLDNHKGVTDAFEERYGIDVTTFEGNGEEVARRVSEEGKAGRRGTDVVDIGGNEMVALNRLGLFVPYEPAALTALVPEAKQKGWTGSRIQKFMVSWNTKLVPRGEEPRSFEELAEPRWRGKLAVEASDADWHKALRDHWIETEGKSEEEADRLFQGIARNARVTSSHSLMSELLGAGEFAVAVTAYLYQTRESIAEGASVAYEPIVEPVLSRPNGVGLPETADDPATALLFVEWLLGEQGQKAIEEANSEPSLRAYDALDARELPIDLEAYADERKEWEQRWDKLLRGSEGG
jgi:iron(III) transport system substrate-binding protein